MINSASVAAQRRVLAAKPSCSSVSSAVSCDSGGIPRVFAELDDDAEQEDPEEEEGEEEDEEGSEAGEQCEEPEDDEDMSACISAKNFMTDDRIRREAEASSNEAALPASRGALKKMVMKKPAGKAPTTQCSMGLIKLILARDQTYIVRWNPDSNKWPLVVGVNWHNHTDIGWKLWTLAQKKGMTKERLQKLKANMKTPDMKCLRRPSKRQKIGEPNNDDAPLEIDEQALAQQALAIPQDGDDDDDQDMNSLADDDDETAKYDDDDVETPAWWNELA